jgi:hypothetical protein
MLELVVFVPERDFIVRFDDDFQIPVFCNGIEIGYLVPDQRIEIDCAGLPVIQRLCAGQIE